MAIVTPSAQDRSRNPNYWGIYASAAVLPNTPGFVVPVEKLGPLESGDTAYVAGFVPGFGSGLVHCVTPGTPGAGDAVWSNASAITPQYQWNLNGVLSFFPPQPPGGFGGMLVTDPALAGPGPFDGTRVVAAAGTLASGLFEIILRVPPPVLATTFVEFYRIRAGLITSIALVGIPAVTPFNFSAVSGFPAPADLAVGDLLFVALDGLGAPAGAADLSVSLRAFS